MARRTACVECLGLLSQDNSHHHQQKFCSTVCNQAFNARRLRTLRAARAKLVHNCATCGIEFSFTPIKGGMKLYCSGECKSLQAFAKRRGVSVETVILAKQKQEYRCAICNTHEDDLQRKLVWDHDHECCTYGPQCGSCFRGYLCADCNTILGYAKDNPQRLIKAAEYLTTWSTKKGVT